MPEQYLAFLSYTTIDDQYRRGAITAMRELLELGVRVTTGNRNLRIFQDREGIELGQPLDDRIDQAIGEAQFLIPILTPLFFNSDWCRRELSRFLQKEKGLGRKDLILPIYFVTTPLLEGKAQELGDTLAQEIFMRKRFDWRQNAKLKADDPIFQSGIDELSDEISLALDRVRGRADIAAASAVRKPEIQRAADNIVRNAPVQIPPTVKTILWVDDRPSNNLFEQRGFESYHVQTVISTSTQDALEKLRNTKFDAIISDLNRPPDPHAGYTLLAELRAFDKQTPYFIYAGSRDPEHVREAQRRGAQGCTNIGAELIQMVLARISPELAGENTGSKPRILGDLETP